MKSKTKHTHTHTYIHRTSIKKVDWHLFYEMSNNNDTHTVHYYNNNISEKVVLTHFTFVMLNFFFLLVL